MHSNISIYALKEETQQSDKRILCEAIARRLSGDYKNTAKILGEAEEFITAKNGELARSWYLSAGGIFTFVIFVGGLFIRVTRY